MTNHVARQTNMTGANEKIGFKHLHLKDVVIGKSVWAHCLLSDSLRLMDDVFTDFVHSACISK